MKTIILLFGFLSVSCVTSNGLKARAVGSVRKIGQF